ncbi:MAG TPA: ABC transporter permease [Planctomycetes bacterium]|nr:ABC transporter permease [Planctomycetota bacterium]
MARFLTRRLLQIPPVLLGILLLVFFLIDAGLHDLSPKDLQPGTSLSREEIARRLDAFRTAHRLNDPFPVRFGAWVSDAVRLDFGASLREGRPVTEVIGGGLGPTLLVQIPALLLAYLMGVPLGVFLALRAGRPLVRALNGFLFFLFAVPTFWVATLMVIYLATDAGWPLFPLEGLASRGAPPDLLDRAWHLVLPVTALSLPLLVWISRLTRDLLLDVRASAWARTLRAAGFSEARIVGRYGLREALGPLAIQLGVLIPGLVGGSIIVERIFNLPGLGQVLWNATFARDFPVLQALVLATAVATLGGFLLADTLGRLSNPRRADS